MIREIRISTQNTILIEIAVGKNGGIPMVKLLKIGRIKPITAP